MIHTDLHADYVEVRDMLAEYGLGDEDVDVRKGRSLFRNFVLNYGAPKQAIPSSYWVFSHTEEDPLDVLMNYSAEKLESTNLWDSVTRYGRLHRKLLGQV
jgi:hypothetical protein